MYNKELELFVKQVAKTLATGSYLTDFCQIPTKITVESALNTELGNHLAYAKK